MSSDLKPLPQGEAPTPALRARRSEHAVAPANPALTPDMVEPNPNHCVGLLFADTNGDCGGTPPAHTLH